MTAPATPRYRLPYGDFDAALNRLDTIIRGGWSPRIAGMVKSTRTYAYHGGFALDGEDLILVPDGTIVIPDNASKYVQRTPDGTVTADDALDLDGKIPMAFVETLMGELVHFEDIRDATEASLLAGGPTVKSGGTTILTRAKKLNFIGATVEDTADDEVAITILGGSGVGGDPALMPPTSPTPESDEYDAGVLDPANTLRNWGTSAYAFKAGRLVITGQKSGAGGTHANRIITRPHTAAGAFKIHGRVTNHAKRGDCGGGLVLYNTSTGKFITLQIRQRVDNSVASCAVAATYWSNFSTPTNNILDLNPIGAFESPQWWLQIRYDGTDLIVDLSTDGVYFENYGTTISAATALGGAPDEFGTVVNAPVSSVDATVAIDMVRCFHNANQNE